MTTHRWIMLASVLQANYEYEYQSASVVSLSLFLIIYEPIVRCWESAPESVKPTVILWNFRIQILVLLIKPSIFSVPRMINVTFHAPVCPKNLRSVGCHGILNILQIRWF